MPPSLHLRSYVQSIRPSIHPCLPGSQAVATVLSIYRSIYLASYLSIPLYLAVIQLSINVYVSV